MVIANRISRVTAFVLAGLFVVSCGGGTNSSTAATVPVSTNSSKQDANAPVPACEVGAAATAPIVKAAQRRVWSKEYGARWPFTVHEGVLWCVRRDTGELHGDAVYFTSGSTTYAVNGVAKSRARECPDIEAIWSTRPPSPPAKVVARVPESIRQEIFRAEAACPEQAQRAADAAIPNVSSSGDVKRLAAYERKLGDQCMAVVRNKYKLTAKELDLIDAEGYALHWPPAAPLRTVSIGPIIDDGLNPHYS